MVPFFVLRMYFVLSGALLFAAVSLAKKRQQEEDQEGKGERKLRTCVLLLLLLLLRLHSSRHDVVLVLQGCK